MVLGKLPGPGRPTIWMTVGQGPTALAVGAGGGCLDIFILLYLFSPISPSLWETARYRLKYCLKGPLNPKQPTNQPILRHLPDTALNVTNWPIFVSRCITVVCLLFLCACIRLGDVLLALVIFAFFLKVLFVAL